MLPRRLPTVFRHTQPRLPRDYLKSPGSKSHFLNPGHDQLFRNIEIAPNLENHPEDVLRKLIKDITENTDHQNIHGESLKKLLSNAGIKIKLEIKDNLSVHYFMIVYCIQFLYIHKQSEVIENVNSLIADIPGLENRLNDLNHESVVRSVKKTGGVKSKKRRNSKRNTNKTRRATEMNRKMRKISLQRGGMPLHFILFVIFLPLAALLSKQMLFGFVRGYIKDKTHENQGLIKKFNELSDQRYNKKEELSEIESSIRVDRSFLDFCINVGFCTSSQMKYLKDKVGKVQLTIDKLSTEVERLDNEIKRIETARESHRKNPERYEHWKSHTKTITQIEHSLKTHSKQIHGVITSLVKKTTDVKDHMLSGSDNFIKQDASKHASEFVDQIRHFDEEQIRSYELGFEDWIKSESSSSVLYSILDKHPDLLSVSHGSNFKGVDIYQGALNKLRDMDFSEFEEKYPGVIKEYKESKEREVAEKYKKMDIENKEDWHYTPLQTLLSERPSQRRKRYEKHHDRAYKRIVPEEEVEEDKEYTLPFPEDFLYSSDLGFFIYSATIAAFMSISYGYTKQIKQKLVNNEQFVSFYRMFYPANPFATRVESTGGFLVGAILGTGVMAITNFPTVTSAEVLTGVLVSGLAGATTLSITSNASKDKHGSFIDFMKTLGVGEDSIVYKKMDRKDLDFIRTNMSNTDLDANFFKFYIIDKMLDIPEFTIDSSIKGIILDSINRHNMDGTLTEYIKKIKVMRTQSIVDTILELCSGIINPEHPYFNEQNINNLVNSRVGENIKTRLILTNFLTLYSLYVIFPLPTEEDIKKGEKLEQFLFKHFNETLRNPHIRTIQQLTIVINNAIQSVQTVLGR